MLTKYSPNVNKPVTAAYKSKVAPPRSTKMLIFFCIFLSEVNDTSHDVAKHLRARLYYTHKTFFSTYVIVKKHSIVLCISAKCLK